MARYGLVINNAVTREADFDTPPISKIVDGKPMWRPIDTVTATYDPITQTYTVSRAIQTHRIVDTWVIADLPTETKRANLKSHLAAYRYEREVGGMPVGEMTIVTDDRSKTLINGAWASATSNPAFTTKFKTTSGWVTLNAAQTIGIAVAVGNFVNKCFTSEEAVEAAINNGSVTTTAQVESAFDTAMAS